MGTMTEATAKDGVSLTYTKAGECPVLRCHPRSRTARIRTVRLPLVSSMALGKFFDCSVPQLPFSKIVRIIIVFQLPLLT